MARADERGLEGVAEAAVDLFLARARGADTLPALELTILALEVKLEGAGKEDGDNGGSEVDREGGLREGGRVS